MPDHVHLLIGMRPNQSLSNLIQDIKCSSSRWINEQHLVNGQFNWQHGFGAFSYKKVDLPVVINYIRNQENHHHQKTFREEYVELLEEFGIEYDERYIFKNFNS